MHDKNTIHELIKEFYSYAKENMGFSKPCKVFLHDNPENGADPLGKSGYYDPQNMEIHLYITGRHPKDVLRSCSHELMHHTQNCRGDFANMGATTKGYAQKDQELRKSEEEAYKAAMYFRDFEDSKKNQGIEAHRGNQSTLPGSIPLKQHLGPAGDHSGGGKGNRSV